VVNADTALHLPDFRASERAFQLLTQVAGRAGRSILGGQVIIQTYCPESFAVQTASRHDYAAFFEQELAFRREHNYPPFSQLVRLLYADNSSKKATAEAERVSRLLRLNITRRGLPNLDVIGPAPCFLSRIAGKYRWHLILRGREPTTPLVDLALPTGWRVDVDPVSLL
jgi:primosomal protein N' (replication factor Y)